MGVYLCFVCKHITGIAQQVINKSVLKRNVNINQVCSHTQNCIILFFVKHFKVAVETHRSNIYTKSMVSSSVSDLESVYSLVFFTGFVTVIFCISKADDHTAHCILHNSIFPQYSSTFITYLQNPAQPASKKQLL